MNNYNNWQGLFKVFFSITYLRILINLAKSVEPNV